jgi:phosphoribosylformimino-5-aminoimidazole carboxamide ribonucleotide (ProFAR) isomerase
MSVEQAASAFSELGVSLFLVTSVERDGTLAGPDFETLAKVCRLKVGVIAAGGIGSLDEFIALKRLGVRGVVVGKALYEGCFTLGEALKTVADD